MRTALVTFAVAALAITAGALAAGQKDAFNLKATLKASAEVPKPKGVRVGAVGVFTGKAIEGEKDRASLTWKLTFTKLTGAVGQAHIHIGKPGKAGNVMVALCGPCKSGQRGSTSITHAQLATVRAGRAYVNVHTKKNAAGEIRGQVKATETTAGDDPQPPPPPPGDPPPGDPYP
jgi:hypothetical protein